MKTHERSNFTRIIVLRNYFKERLRNKTLYIYYIHLVLFASACFVLRSINILHRAHFVCHDVLSHHFSSSSSLYKWNILTFKRQELRGTSLSFAKRSKFVHQVDQVSNRRKLPANPVQLCGICLP